MMKKKIIIIAIIIVAITATVGIIIAINKNNNKVVEENVPDETKQESQITQVEDFVGRLSDGTLLNTNAKMNVPSTLGDLSVDLIRLTLKNGVTTFRANVTNNGSTTTDLKSVKLTLFDENGEELVTAVGILNAIEPEKTKELAISITSDYIHACGYRLVEE